MVRIAHLLLVLALVEGQNVGSLRKDGVSWRRPHNDLDTIFNVYDASFLSVAWPRIRNGVHLLLELDCWDDVTVFFKDLADGKPWAYDVMDASGRYPSGIFSGTRYWLGSKQQCLGMSNDYLDHGHNETLTALRNNDYVSAILRREKNFNTDDEEWSWVMQDETMQQLVAAEHRPPYQLAYTTLSIQLNVTKFVMYKSYDITLGVCLPRSCTADDVEAIVSFSLALTGGSRTNGSVPRAAAVTSVRQIDDYDLAEEPAAILIITITLALITLAIGATALDLDIIKCFSYSKKSMSFDLPQHRSTDRKLVDELRRKHIQVMNVDVLPDRATSNSVPIMKVSKSGGGGGGGVSCGGAGGSCTRCGRYRRQLAGARLQYSSFASLSTEDKRNKLLCKLLLCFSLRQSAQRVFNKRLASRELYLVHALKVFATFWVVFVHVAVVVSYASNNAGDLNERGDVYYILATGTLAFDTLFFVSGLISSHHFFYLKSRYSVKELVSFGGACGQVMQFVCFVTNRVIRLLPSYAYAVLAAGVSARVAQRGAALTLPDRDHAACAAHCWRNLLYITTLYPSDEQCMQISWFLSTETQLHALGALACAASVSASGSASGSANIRARLVLAVSAAFVLAAVAADFTDAFVHNDIWYRNAYDMYEGVVARAWACVTPYFAGVFAGWLVHTMHGRLTLSKGARVAAWAASGVLAGSGAALALCAAAGPLARLQHVAWPAAMLWPALAATARAGAANTEGAWRGVRALSRLSPGVVVTHALAARLLLPDRALHADTTTLFQYFVGTSVVSVVMSLLLALLIEMPCCSLLRRLSDSAV